MAIVKHTQDTVLSLTCDHPEFFPADKPGDEAHVAATFAKYEMRNAEATTQHVLQQREGAGG